MKDVKKIADICKHEVLQKAWKPQIGDTFFVRETRPYDNKWFDKLATIAVVRYGVSRSSENKTKRLGVRDYHTSNDYTFYLASQNTWVPTIKQLLDMIFSGEDGWSIGGINDLVSFLHVLSEYAQMKDIHDFYELLIRFTLSEHYNIEI